MIVIHIYQTTQENCGKEIVNVFERNPLSSKMMKKRKNTVGQSKLNQRKRGHFFVQSFQQNTDQNTSNQYFQSSDNVIENRTFLVRVPSIVSCSSTNMLLMLCSYIPSLTKGTHCIEKEYRSRDWIRAVLTKPGNKYLISQVLNAKKAKS